MANPAEQCRREGHDWQPLWSAPGVEVVACSVCRTQRRATEQGWSYWHPDTPMPERETWRPKMIFGFVFTWESQAEQYARFGLPGITYERHYANEEDAPPGAPVDCLLMRDVHGKLVGILNHYPESDPGGLEQAGNINVWVRPDRQKRGIGTALVRAAQERWPINFQQQRYSPEGLKLLSALRRQGAGD